MVSCLLGLLVVSEWAVIARGSLVAGGVVVGRGGDRPRAAVVLVFDEAERVEAGGDRARVGIARDAAPPAMHIGQAVERDGVAKEFAADEDPWQRALVFGVEAQLDGPAELRAHLEVAAAPPYGAVLADLARGAMQEDLVELLVARDGADLVRVGEQVIARD